ncbi:hypothetical protein ACHHYP_07348 [Achlya hypogyna]|uniref:Secreted protein n=1 Tax=Achlya hypogyna TaxID=1202772 RepID=A0A0A7CNM4_ACHHY|nr:secreted protein [Achlya hypogyna]OQR99061.1 hypothetical protein ACHHYP_07348 [Achlya hypogyna]
MKPHVVRTCIVAVMAALAWAQDASVALGDASYVVRLHSSTADALRMVNERNVFDDSVVTELAGEPMPMTSSNGKRYICYVPVVTEDNDVEESNAPQTRVEIGREITGKLQRKCVNYVDEPSRTFYEICPSKVAIYRMDMDENRKFLPATRSTLADFEVDADLKPLVDYKILRYNAKSPEPQMTPDTLLYTQHFGEDIAVQFACADVVGLTIVGLHLPSLESSAIAFLLASRSFCLDKYAVSALDLSVAHFLKPLTSTNTCIKRTEGWWTYEVCFGDKISQYHREQTGEITAEFSLGRWSSAANDALQSNHQAMLTEFMDGTHDKEQPAYEEVYDSGTPCDAVDRTRSTRLLMFCPLLKSQPAYIISVQETSTCTYTIKVATPSVCGHPHFAKEDMRRAELSQTIHCVPNEDDTPTNESSDPPTDAPATSSAKDEL